uniref:Uncharacterized protein n=1 Tax=Amphimedon queenslandica TaxID=400682 RepID=A0A1X7VN73_AMPQE
MFASALGILCALFFLQLKGADGISARDDVIDKLLDKIAKSQIKETVPFVFPVTLYKQKGVYPSYVHFDYSGTAGDTVLRREEFKIFDNNAFVTLWVSSILLETVRFNKAAQPSDEQMLNAIQAVYTYHDKNFLDHNETRLVFWPQTYNETAGTWSCAPLNLDKTVAMGEEFFVLAEKMFKDLDLKKFASKIAEFIQSIVDSVAAFYIPADFDDTFVNIGLGSLLKNYQSVSRQPYLSWLSNNTNNVQSAVKALKEYSYKPFSSSSGNSYIDPRTYFYLRKFLQKSHGTGQLFLVTTWVESLNESRAKYYKKYRMPFNINNVDLTVSANVLYGLTAAVLSDMQDPNSWFDEEVQMIYLNTTSLVMYEISNNFSSRPDLALTYYPSVFNFYWFTSRILNLLNLCDQLPYPVMQTVREIMRSIMYGVGTEFILKQATMQDNYIFFDDFLGVNDTDEFGKPVNHGDDRISSTSMAINALFYIWSNASSGQLSPNVPDNVQDTLVRACDWLTDEALSDKLEHMSVFFSGSVKTGDEYNEATGVWLCRPVNIGKTMDFGNKAEPVVKRMFTDIGLQGLWNEISPLVNEILTASSAFYIPADFDDTFVNIGFGSLLKNYQSVSREPYLSWLSSNSNLESAIAALKKYSYKPFSSEFDSKAIDPRTYFYMRHFLEEAKSKGELSLVTTWVQSLSESRDNFYNHYTMPFNVNNVDLTVSANVLYGLTAAVLSDMQDPNSWFDEEVQMIYLNTTSLVMYEISNNFSSRPDLALTYYPSVFNFYWFTSRILNLLNSYDQLPYPVMQTVKMRMSSTLRGEGTNDILRRATRHNDFIYFDDFLGDNDKNLYGERVNRGDDRISSTAMAVNALFYIWANASGVLLTDTPEPVTYTLIMACHWLSDNALSDRLEHINAFFSGSVKLGSVDIPFFYPLNYIERVNGSLISSDHHFLGSDSDVISAVIGTIQEDRYKELLEHKHYGYKTPTEFHGFNSKHVPFPFWSSTILTDASSALALTQCTLNNM